MCRAETELAQIENRQANAERNASKRGFGMSNVNEKNKRINFLNAYQNVSSAPENQKVSFSHGFMVWFAVCQLAVCSPQLMLLDFFNFESTQLPSVQLADLGV